MSTTLDLSFPNNVYSGLYIYITKTTFPMQMTEQGSAEYGVVKWNRYQLDLSSFKTSAHAHVRGAVSCQVDQEPRPNTVPFLHISALHFVARQRPFSFIEVRPLHALNLNQWDRIQKQFNEFKPRLTTAPQLGASFFSVRTHIPMSF